MLSQFLWEESDMPGLAFGEAARGKEICYGQLGCFSDEKPWAGIFQRPIKLFPWSPKDIDTRFLLYTNENPDNFQLITGTEPDTIEASNFQLGRKTRFIIHGFIDKGEENWLSDMCKKMFKVEKVNCICVDWRGGSRTMYTQAVQNIRVVGAEIALLIQVLSMQLGYSPEDVHLIGHSLGAHAAAEAGRRLEGRVGRITGLDPAEPCFQGTPEEVRLDPSDAVFVDVIHTDSAPIVPFLGFGMSQKVGHLDFFPNGGKQMPGCKKNILSTIIDINGIWEGWRYKVSVTLSGKKKVNGVIRIALYGSNGNSKQYEIFKGSLKPDASHMRDIDVDLNVGKIQKVKFLWNNNVINLFRPKLGASQITVQSGEDGTEYSFCSGDTVQEDVLQSLYPC
ncbi:pancreatic lipase-related protein 2 isoform X3 [Callithrix jacchus]|uniref:pancreatic lipase-related protein 2 isoform X3 n=1 Tax=Callithrix jacchus TaxID=9483 RepID=UPI0023DD3E57|nr:pancreatic lipase-related protein 2 isoform X3 [Callithrix jacchus]